MCTNDENPPVIGIKMYFFHLEQWFWTFFVERNPNGAFQWLEEPLFTYLHRRIKIYCRFWKMKIGYSFWFICNAARRGYHARTYIKAVMSNLSHNYPWTLLAEL